MSDLDLNIGHLTEDEIAAVSSLSEAITEVCRDRPTHVCLHGIASALGLILASTMGDRRSTQIIGAVVGAHAAIRAEHVWDDIQALRGEQAAADSAVTEIKAEADALGIKVEGGDNAGT